MLAKNKKKILALMLVLSLIVSIMPAITSVVKAEGSLNQIDNYGGDFRYYNDNGNELSGGGRKNAVVAVKKSIAATDNENEFTITLDAFTSEEVQQSIISPDVAVVLVMDVSGSMNTAERLPKAIEAAQAFVQSLGDNANGAARYVSIVTFNNNARVFQTWIDITQGTNLADLKTKIGTMTASSYTFMQGGLLLARNLFNNTNIPKVDGVKIENRMVVLLSDGEPNRSTNTNPTSLDNISNNNSNNDNARSRAITAANNIKNGTNTNASTLYTIAYGSGSDSTWLQNNIASPNSAYSAADADELPAVFEKIGEDIELLAQAWVITDPMGTGIVLNETVNADNRLVQDGTAKNFTFFNSGTKTLSLELREMSPKNGGATVTQVGDVSFAGTGKSFKQYSFTYNIKLDTLVRTETGATNGSTFLNYAIVRNNEVVKSGLKADFSVPAVHGLTGNVSFNKTDDAGTGLAGFAFTLTHATNSAWTRTAISGADGTVTFSGIPSGQSYILTEDAFTNPDYEHNDDSHNVTVSWGEVSISNMASGNFVNERTGYNVIFKYFFNNVHDALHDNPVGSNIKPGASLSHIVVSDYTPATKDKTSGDTYTYLRVEGSLPTTMGNSDIVINVYYVKHVDIVVTKTIALDADETLPGTFEFTFTLWNGSKKIATATLDESNFQSGNTATATFAFESGIKLSDFIGASLTLKEAHPANWSTNDSTIAGYVTVGENGAVTYRSNNNPGEVVNSFEQQPDPVSIVFDKFFVNGEGADFENDNFFGQDGGRLNHDIPEHTHDEECEEVCTNPEHTEDEDHDEDCVFECPIEEHTHDASCYSYDFVFRLMKKGDPDVQLATQTITLTGAELIDLIENGAATRITFANVENALSSTLYITEDTLGYLGWSGMSATGDIVVSRLGRVTYPAIGNEPQDSASGTNTFGGITPPSFSFSKKVLDLRNNNAEINEGTFTFTLTDGNGFSKTYSLSGAGSVTVNEDLEQFIGEQSFTLTLSEVPGDMDGMTYDNTVYTITFTLNDTGNGYVVSGIENGAVFRNQYFRPITPEITIVKTVSGFDGTRDFVFDVEFGDLPLARSSAEPVTKTITYTKGGTNQTSFALPTNFTGTVTISEQSEESTDPNAKWVYDTSVYVLTYVDGVLVNKTKDDEQVQDQGELTGTVTFHNSYHAQSILVTKTADLSGSNLYTGPRDVYYKVEVVNNGQELLDNLVITDTRLSQIKEGTLSLVYFAQGAEAGVEIPNGGEGAISYTIVDGEIFVTLPDGFASGDMVEMTYTITYNSTGTFANEAEASASAPSEVFESISDKDDWTVSFYTEVTPPPPGPSYNYYTVTVNYLEIGTEAVLATKHVSALTIEGSAYDVTTLSALDIDGYTLQYTTGDAITGTLNANKVINVWYSEDVEIVEPTPPLEDGDPEDGSDTDSDIDIQDPDVPLTGDSSMAALFIALLVGSISVLVVTVLKGSKRAKSK